jgi:predicted DNA-binding transcriptional regulator AlpA
MEKFIRVKALAELTGIKECTWRKWITKNECPVPYRRTRGGMLLFSESDILRWIENLPEIQGEQNMEESIA